MGGDPQEGSIQVNTSDLEKNHISGLFTPSSYIGSYYLLKDNSYYGDGRPNRRELGKTLKLGEGFIFYKVK